METVLPTGARRASDDTVTSRGLPECLLPFEYFNSLRSRSSDAFVAIWENHGDDVRHRRPVYRVRGLYVDESCGAHECLLEKITSRGFVPL